MCGSGWCAPSIHTTNSGGSTSKSTNTTFLFGFAHSHKQALLVCANTLAPTSGAFIVSFLAKKKEKASSSCNQVHPSCHITLSPPKLEIMQFFGVIKIHSSVCCWWEETTPPAPTMALDGISDIGGFYSASIFETKAKRKHFFFSFSIQPKRVQRRIAISFRCV